MPDTSTTRVRAAVIAYGTGGAPKEIVKENGLHYSYIYDYPVESSALDNLPVAEVINASVANIAYTSFESAAKGGWTFSAATITNPASVTGNKCYNLAYGNITRSVNSSVTFIITFWLKDNTGTASVNSSSATSLFSRNGWTLYTKTVSSTSTVTISGTGKIDELRLYPQGAQMRTMTYRPHFGISSECDLNNKVIYYDYDGFGRLMLVRDENKRIIKKNCYTYKDQTEDCGLYGNVAKSGNFSRSNCGYGYTTSAVTYTVAANTYYSTSQAGADGVAQADVDINGQDNANTNGPCTPGYYNEQRSGLFTKSNCGEGYMGDTYNYIVPAGYYISTVSQAAANQLAQDEVDQHGQLFVDSFGYCIPLTQVYYNNYYYSYYPIYFTFTNTYTNEQYFFETDPWTWGSQALGYLPPGYYDVEIFNPYASGSTYYTLGCYQYAYGYGSWTWAYSIYIDDYCNTISN